MSNLLCHHAAVLGVKDPLWANVSALLHFDGPHASLSFPDATGRVWTRNGNVEVSTAKSKFGGASGRFYGGRIQATADAGFVFGTGNFTIEAWVCFHTAGRGYLYSNNTNSAAIILNQSTGIVEIYGPSSWVINSTTGGAFALDTWYHLALVRNGNTWRVYRDGVQVGTATDSRSWGVATGTTDIGMNATGTATPLLAFVDELRITKGVARYTANFTPPSSPFQSG